MENEIWIAEMVEEGEELELGNLHEESCPLKEVDYAFVLGENTLCGHHSGILTTIA